MNLITIWRQAVARNRLFLLPQLAAIYGEQFNPTWRYLGYQSKLHFDLEKAFNKRIQQ